MSALCAPHPYQHLMLLVFLTLAKMFLEGNSLSGSFTSCETWFSVSHFLNAFFVHLWTKCESESESHSVLSNSLQPHGAPSLCPTSFAFANSLTPLNILYAPPIYSFLPSSPCNLWTSYYHQSCAFSSMSYQPTPVFLPGESQGRGSLVGCCLWGRTESDTNEAT